MKLLFVDETGDANNKEYFGLSLALIDSSHYPKLKTDYQAILKDNGWDINKEFKGSYLFSSTQGCSSVSIDKRIYIAREIFKMNKSTSNSRIKFAYLHAQTNDTKKTYLSFLPELLSKFLPRFTSPKIGKNLISVYCDYRSDIKSNEIQSVIQPILEHKGYVLLENVVMTQSNFDTVGILYADLVGYCRSRIDNISKDSDLFNSFSAEDLQQSSQYKKLLSSTDLIELIKSIIIYTVKE